MTELYHTALSTEQSDAFPREWWAGGGCEAFLHDVSNGLAPEFASADILYADLPWQDGYEEFLRRAAEAGNDAKFLPYGEWLYRLNAVLADCGKPWIVVAGKAASRYMGCEWFRPVRLNGSVAWAMGARAPRPPEDVTDADGLLQWLSGNPEYGIIGDFCAGYGRACRVFVEAGKQFVASDINPVCIGHIAREAPRWQSATT